MNLIRFNVNDELRDAFKLYCVQNDTTMSKVLIDYITTLVGNAGKAPAKEKNSGERTAPAKIYHCPYCGDELTTMTEVNRLKHIDICEKLQKGVFCSRTPLRS